MSGKQIARVLDAIQSGYCNTSSDVADVVGISIAQASNYISELIRDGLVRRIGRTMPSGTVDKRGPPYQLFEATPPLHPSPIGLDQNDVDSRLTHCQH